MFNSKQLKKMARRSGKSLKAYARKAATEQYDGADIAVAWLENKRKTPVTRGGGDHSRLGPEGRRAGALMCAGGTHRPHVAQGSMFGGGGG